MASTERVGLKARNRLTFSGISPALERSWSKFSRHFSVTPAPLVLSVISFGPSRESCRVTSNRLGTYPANCPKRSKTLSVHSGYEKFVEAKKLLKNG